MVAINIQKSGLSLGVGVADIVAERWDKNQGYDKPLQNAQDIGRLALALIGYGAQIWGPAKYQSLSEALALSVTPLVVKTVWRAAEMQMNAESHVAVFTPRRVAAGRTKGWVPPLLDNQPGGYRFSGQR